VRGLVNNGLDKYYASWLLLNFREPAGGADGVRAKTNWAALICTASYLAVLMVLESVKLSS
jgi:hypothetical protein